MKQKFLFLLVVLSFLLPVPLLAYHFESGGIYYDFVSTYDDNGNLISCGASIASSPEANKYSGDVVIPSTVAYNGKQWTVTSIGRQAFSGCSLLESVNIPTSVTSIDSEAFSLCSSLQSIDIPNSVTSIDAEAFYLCSSLQSIDIPNSVTSIGNNAFSGCTSLVSIELPNSVTTIGENAFSGCSSLASIDIPTSVTSFAESVFYRCSSLVSVELPPVVTSIGDNAFMGCSSLTSIVIPNSVTSIGNWAFNDCRSLPSIDIPNSVTSIGSNAFEGCSSLASIVIPKSVTTIGNSAFSGCSSLESIEIPTSVTSIGNWAFNDCRSLPSIDIPNSVTSIGERAFGYCSSLVSVVIPNSVTTIGGEAFQRCTSLKSVNIPTSVTSIENGTFENCTSLASVEIPSSVTSIGASAFAGCTSLASVEIPSSVTSIGARAFGDCLNLSIGMIWGEKVTFGEYNFGYEKYLLAPEGGVYPGLEREILRFNAATTELQDDWTLLTDNGKTLLFAPISNGADYAIPEGVTKILSESLRKMNYDEHSQELIIGTLTIPSTIEEIEPNAFLNTKIERVNFTDWTKWYANAKLGNLYSNPYWNSIPYVGGVQMVTPNLLDGITEIPDYINYGLQFKGEIELPRTIKRIGSYAFYNNKELYSVILPRTLEEIGESAFEGCTLLENPSFPSGLKKIEDGAYKGCTSITEITLPEGLTELGSRPTGIEITDDDLTKGVFESCTALEKAVLVADIDYLADNLFKYCGVLDKIYFPLQLKIIGNSAFEECLTLDEITFPATLESIGANAFKGKYQFSSPPKRGSLSKLEIPDGVKKIGKEAFAYQSIAHLSIGSGLEVIPDHAFYDNYDLKIVNFSEGLQEIKEYAFSSQEWGYHPNIGSVVLPSTVTSIADNAFFNVYIGSLVIPDEVESLGSGSCGYPSVLTLGTYVKDIAADAFDFEKLYTIRLKAHMPPSLSDAFPLTSEQNDQLTLIVNKDRRKDYSTNARWKQIDRIIEEGDSEVEIYLDGTYPLAEEIRIQSGYMPSVVTKMKVDGPLTDNDLRVIKENMLALTSLDMSHVTNVTALPDRQFERSLLTEVVLPSNLESIGEYAFNNCRLLELTELPASVKSIGNYAFSDCPKVDLTVLPASLEQIGEHAFSSTGMLEVIAGENLAEVGQYAFKDCKLLERVDLEATGLTEIAEGVFSGCSELDEVILPQTVESIGRYGFSGAALRNIDFASDVTEIGNYAFSNNRRLVSATLPESLTTVGDGMFADCRRLISVSMPGEVTSVGTKVVSNDRKLANLSCSTPDAPDAATGAFDDLRFRYVTLTIPTLSFRKYLSAPQWGRFESTQNTIKTSVGKGVKVTCAAEDEYQDMVTEDALEAAQEAAAAQGGKMSPARAMRRAAARAKTTQNFATVFDGAQLMIGKDGGANRIFITPKLGVTVTSILLDGEELIGSYDGQSVLLPEGKSGTLDIITDAPPTQAENIVLNEVDLDMTMGETVALTATVEPADTDDKTVTWSSSDDSIAVVDENGEVEIVGVGNVTITAACGEASSACTLKCYPQLGDANWNGDVTIADAVDITNYVVKKKTAPEGWDEKEWTGFYVAGANANQSEDDAITFADASAAVTIALAQPMETAERDRLSAPNRGVSSSSDALVLGAGSAANGTIAVGLANLMQYVALQADIIAPEGVTVDVKAGQRAASHTLQTMRFADNRVRVALFNLGNKAFAEGNDPLLEIVADGEGDVTVCNVLAADSDANEYTLGVVLGELTGVDGIGNDNIVVTTAADGIHVANAMGNMIEVCTMDGRIVKALVATDTLEIINLPAGIYVVRVAGKTIKVIL